MESLIDAVNRKFGNPTVPIKSIYRKEAEQVEPVTEVKDLRDGFLYYALTFNEELPGNPTFKFSPQMEDFFKALQDEEGLDNEDLAIIREAFASQRLKFSTLLKADELAITDAKLKEYGIIQGGLRTAILSVIQNNQ